MNSLSGWLKSLLPEDSDDNIVFINLYKIKNYNKFKLNLNVNNNIILPETTQLAVNICILSSSYRSRVTRLCHYVLECLMTHSSKNPYWLIVPLYAKCMLYLLLGALWHLFQCANNGLLLFLFNVGLDITTE